MTKVPTALSMKHVPFPFQNMFIMNYWFVTELDESEFTRATQTSASENTLIRQPFPQSFSYFTETDNLARILLFAYRTTLLIEQRFLVWKPFT